MFQEVQELHQLQQDQHDQEDPARTEREDAVRKRQMPRDLLCIKDPESKVQHSPSPQDLQQSQEVQKSQAGH